MGEHNSPVNHNPSLALFQGRDNAIAGTYDVERQHHPKDAKDDEGSEERLRKRGDEG